MRIFVYPGSFDPVTNGHMDVIYRTSKLCDKLIVAVGNNEGKKNTFTIDERVELIRRAVKDMDNIEVESFSNLLIDFVRKKNARVIVKGLRAVSDFEYEFQMALLNKNLDPEIETLFMMTNVLYAYLSSSAVKELARNGGSIDGLVPDCIKDDILRKFSISSKPGEET